MEHTKSIWSHFFQKSRNRKKSREITKNHDEIFEITENLKNLTKKRKSITKACRTKKKHYQKSSLISGQFSVEALERLTGEQSRPQARQTATVRKRGSIELCYEGEVLAHNSWGLAQVEVVHGDNSKSKVVLEPVIWLSEFLKKKF